MGDDTERKRLGIAQPIARRDFLNGLAIAIGGTYGLLSHNRTGTGSRFIEQSVEGSEQTPELYPPLRSELRGNYPAAIADFDDIANGKYERLFPGSDACEDYDLVIVGGGISGLAAAYFYRAALGPKPKILILENIC